LRSEGAGTGKANPGAHSYGAQGKRPIAGRQSFAAEDLKIFKS
jgi:hypothetical protein